MESRRSSAYLVDRLAANVRRIRLGLGLSQEELADRSGLHRTYVGAIERAERNVSVATVEALATGLDRDPVDLITE